MPGEEIDTKVLLDCGVKLAAPSAKQVYPVVTGASSLGNGLELVQRLERAPAEIAKS